MDKKMTRADEMLRQLNIASNGPMQTIMRNMAIRQEVAVCAWLLDGYEAGDLAIEYSTELAIRREGDRIIIRDNWEVKPSVTTDNFTRLITTA